MKRQNKDRVCGFAWKDSSNVIVSPGALSSLYLHDNFQCAGAPQTSQSATGTMSAKAMTCLTLQHFVLVLIRMLTRLN